MCGIVTAVHLKGGRVSKKVKEEYEKQKSRGSEGFGFASIDNEGIVSVQRSETEHKILKSLKHDGASIVMFHHRFPTSTINVEECTHPIFVSHEDLDYDYYIVHNGVIRNDDELKKKHETLGYVYRTELKVNSNTTYKSAYSDMSYVVTDKETSEYNDSEALAIEIARFLDGASNKIDAVGTIAFICYKVHKSGKNKGRLIAMYYGRNGGNPLCYSTEGNIMLLKSVGGTPLDINKIYSIVFEVDGKFTKDFVYGETISQAVGYETEGERNGVVKYNSIQSYPSYQKYHSTEYSGGVYGNDDYELADDYKRTNAGFTYDSTKKNSVKRLFDNYLALSNEFEVYQDEVSIGEDLIADANSDNREILSDSVSFAKSQLVAIQAKLDSIEEEYYFSVGGVKDFYDALEEYMEINGILKDYHVF